MSAFRAALGADFTVADSIAALARCGGDTERATRSLLYAANTEKGRAGGDAPVPGPRGVKAERSFGSAAPPPLHAVKVEPADECEVEVKREPIFAEPDDVMVKVEAPGEAEAKVELRGEVGVKVKRQPIEADGPFQEQAGRRVKQEEEADKVDVKEEADEVELKEEAEDVDVKEEEADEVDVKEEADEVDLKEEAEDVDMEEEADEVDVKEEANEVYLKEEAEDIYVKEEESEDVDVKEEEADEVDMKEEDEDADVKEEEADEVDLKEEAEDVDVKEEEADEVDVKAEADEVDLKEEAEDVDVKEETDEVDVKEEADEVDVKDEESGVSEDEVEIIDPPPRPKKKLRCEGDGADFIDLTTSHPVPYLNAKPVRALPPLGAVAANEWRTVVAPTPAELEQYPPDHREWYLFRKSYATGLSTCRGRKLLDKGEVVHFALSSFDWLYGRARVSVRQAVALSEIVRFSTNRAGEIGKLSPVWAKCLAPLVSSSKIMIQGKMVFPMVELRLMQEVLLYVSFYINRSCLYLIDPENACHPDNPLRPLLKLLSRFGES